jgi:hypothetical protein
VTGPELYYHLAPFGEATGVTLRVVSHDDVDFDLFVGAGGSCEPETCLYASGSVVGEILTFVAEPGEDYWIVVDGFPTPENPEGEGRFDLSIECGAPGDFCGAAPIACGESAKGDTSARAIRQDSYFGDACGFNNATGPEETWELAIAEDSAVTVTVESDEPNLVPIVLFAEGDTWCDDRCVVAPVDAGRVVALDATAGDRFFVVIDGLGAPPPANPLPGPSGAYTLSVECAPR